MFDISKVKGYDKLSPERQKVFKSTYQKHMNCIESEELKKKYTPVKVQAIDVGVKVTMKCKTWFHYSWTGEWY